jgi:thiol-disulfide isomerase/thioredoxin
MKRAILLFFFVLASASVPAQSPPRTVWQELQARRAALTAYHQEFEVNQVYVFPYSKRAHVRVEAVDAAGRLWRQVSGRGTAADIRVFDGESHVDIADTEFIRLRWNTKDPDPTPNAYNFDRFDLAKLVEVERKPCGYARNDHTCVVFDVPLKSWANQTVSGATRAQPGMARLAFDTVTGLLVGRSTSQVINQPRNSYRSDLTYRLAQFEYGHAPKADMFALPPNVREVKKFTEWNAKRMKEQLAGKPAPELNLTTLDGKPLSLDSLKGKTVLLDFWATWCPPCRVDGPALDKLHAKYGAQLVIIGLAVGEDRTVVEKFLKEYPHKFPIVLTAENDLPRHYDVAALPTYVIIDAEGHLDTAVEGDRGFDGLRSRLKQAGLDVD